MKKSLHFFKIKGIEISIQLYMISRELWMVAITPVVGSILHYHYINEICNIRIMQLFDTGE